ncbi:MAG TPA: aminotransferase class V-fold PLP-dependent enzyme, partial [Ignavibacteriaceae bacterium]|nr:aminotransferase class V-fold PLP-dependent enzyme [Ignavibacteriaceae bacterium]
SGRLYEPIEKTMLEKFGPFVGNTHSESSITGTTMTLAYHHAHDVIKKHCNAGSDDVIITAGSGMTALINKFQRIMGLKVPEQLKNYLKLPEELKPVVFVSHMEHHSNHTSWLETIADVVLIPPDKDGLVDFETLEKEIKKYKDRKLKIGAFTACSNVTGISTPIHNLAKLMHENNGFCFVDYACAAPYVKIDLHPDDPLEKLDAILFSPHKFLGGPGTPGVLIFDSKLYHNRVPDNPGGGTVDWTNPWGQHKFVTNIEAREDGGTPAFLQTIKAALCIQLKDQMGVENMKKREEELVKIGFEEMKKINGLHLLAENIEERLGAFSFYVDNIHYNLIVKLLNDRFGVQVRGGCSCAGTYGHYLLHVEHDRSKYITDKIDQGDLSEKPGWVRMSVHPTTTNDDLYIMIEGIKDIVKNISMYEKDYRYSSSQNEFFNIKSNGKEKNEVNKWFDLSLTNLKT